MFQICCNVRCGVSGSVLALVPALYEEHYLASVLVRLSGVVDGAGGVWRRVRGSRGGRSGGRGATVVSRGNMDNL